MGSTDQRQISPDRRLPDRWRLWLPDGSDTGLHAETPGQPDGLVHVGESWTTPTLHIDDHSHDAWELYLQIHGTARWQFGDRQQTLAPGWVAAVPPGMRHGHPDPVRPQARHHCAYAAFDAALVSERLPLPAHLWSRPRLLLSPSGWSLQSAFRTLVREVAQDRPFGAQAIGPALHLLLIETARLFHHPRNVGSRIPTHPAIARARALLDEDPARPWTVEALAVAVGLSRAHLSDRFTAQVGQPPYAYLLERRVERCTQLLSETGRQVSEIAADAGFSSASAMARSFRAVLGCSPGQWRDRRSASGGDISASVGSSSQRPRPGARTR